MPRVLIIVNRFNIGGQVSNAAIIAKHLPSNYETMIIGGDKEPGEDSSLFWLEEMGLKPKVLSEMKRALSFKEDRKAYKKIKEIIAQFKPDIVHTHSAKAGGVGRLAAKAMKVPVIIHTYHGHVFHSYFGKAKTSFYKNMERYLARISSKIIVLSKEQQREITKEHKICKESKTAIIPLGFDFSKFTSNQEEKRKSFRSTYNIDENTICTGIIGRLTAIKNHHFFIDAIERVVKLKPKNTFKFFIIGDGELMNDLQDYCHSKNLEIETPESKNPNATIVFTSWIKEVDWALAGLDIVALTSKNEGTPVSLIEAQVAGKPVISTNVGGVKDIVEENVTGRLSAVKDIDTFTTNLFTLIEDDEIRKSMSDKGKEAILEKFSYQRLIRDLDILYTDLLQKKQNKFGK
jgi:glycosyltransferase involved in cell wall biosynthesis